jgi:hypothetical protein
MSDKKSPYLEEYLYLPALSHDSAIIAWGGFFFEIDEDDGVDGSVVPSALAGNPTMTITAQAVKSANAALP